MAVPKGKVSRQRRNSRRAKSFLCPALLSAPMSLIYVPQMRGAGYKGKEIPRDV